MNHNNYKRYYFEGDSENPSYSIVTNAKENFYDLSADALYTQSFKNKRRLSMQLIHAHKITNIKYNDSSPEKLNNGETSLFCEYRQMIDRWTLGNRLGYSYLTYKQNELNEKSYWENSY